MLGVEENRLTIGKDIYYPFSVEMHYFRVDKRHWSVCFERIKRAGFRIISTVVPWNLHQGKNKDIDFNGFQDSRKDLIVFLELAREFGFKVILRPGPWISGQWKNGGIPDFVIDDPELLALNANDEPIELIDQTGVEAGKLVSYMHPHFQHFLNNYFKNLIETTRNYIHPRGPVFMVEFDFETSFCHKTGAGDADYNDYIVKTLFPSFLENKYEDIKTLNAVYKSKHKEFTSIDPPRDFLKFDVSKMPRVFDWFYFKEWYLSDFLCSLEDLFKSYTVLPFFFRSLFFNGEQPLPAFSLTVEGEEDHLVGASVFPDGTAFDLMQKARYIRTMTDFAWAPSFISGNMTSNKAQSEVMFPITDGRRRFFIAAGLAGGFKGFNHYMFINRDNWYGAPVGKDGEIGTGFEIIKRLNISIPKMSVNTIESDNSIVAAFYRPYQWVSDLSGPSKFGYMHRLLHETFNGVCRDFGRLCFDHGVGDISQPDRLMKYKTVFIPVAEFMSKEAQEAIVSLAESGINVIMTGLMPKYDENGKDNTTLARKMHIKTTIAEGIGEVEFDKSQTFVSYLYGTIRTTDTKVKKIATVKGKPVGVVSSRFKGKVFFFSFDLASGGDFHKLHFLESMLKTAKLSTSAYVSDPNVDVVIQKNDKTIVIFLLAPPPGDLSEATDIRTKEILLKVDLRQLGFKGNKIKLYDQFANNDAEEPADRDKPLSTTVDELKNGISMNIAFPEGKMFLVSKT
ncbi:MAG: beta-galactosidase [candidate division Zixibacteria bacterium]|nr:beta-galactosidase [candidate division Zixibacteria bacterium]